MRHSNRLIEEFMLLANISVAEKIQASFPKISVLRCHPEPKMFLLLKVVDVLRRYGIDIDATDSKTMQDSLNAYRPQDLSDKSSLGKWQVLLNLLTVPMQNAQYFCTGMKENIDDYRHYALSVPMYTHFYSFLKFTGRT